MKLTFNLPNTLFILILILSAFSSEAQKKNVRINFGLQGNLPENLFNSSIPKYNNKNGGMGFHLCPTWHYSKHLSLAINMEYAFVIENYQTDAIGGFNILSFSPTAQYYFTENKIRPFIGLGAGLYHVIYHRPQFNLGIRPLIGISLFNVFALSLEYNRILANIEIDSNGRGTFDNYYLAVKGSFSLGVYKSKK